MSAKSAKTKIIPFVIIFNIAYNSYTVFLLTESDPGKFGCIPNGGDPEIVSTADFGKEKQKKMNVCWIV